MAETDILNPSNWAAAGLTFNPNPSYGFSRRMSNNRLMQRPRLGPYIARDVGNAGHVFPLSWINTDLSTAQRVVKFYHDFKNGYFTFINTDWGGRHFVGRFIAEPEAIQIANGKYTIQGATFEEIPTARMLNYPSDWSHDGHPLNALDDFLNPRVALMQGAWTTQQTPAAVTAGTSVNDPTSYEAYNALPAIGDWAQTQYTGWGFRMTLRAGVAFGVVNILLDGIALVTGLDLSNGTVVAQAAIATVTVVFASGGGAATSATITALDVPLDMHRVKIVYGGYSAAAGTSIAFPALEYIY